MKLCAIILGCVLGLSGFGFQTAFAQPAKRVVGKPRARRIPHKKPVTPKPLQDEMDNAAEQAAPQPPERKYMPPAAVETTHELGDIVYVTPVGKFKGNVDYQISSTKAEERANGFLLADAKNDSQQLEFGLNYGLFNGFALGINWSYQLVGNIDTTLPSGTSTRTQNIGYTNPVFSGTYRLMDQDDGKLNFDLSFGYAPKLGNSKSGTTTDNGNALSGADAFAFSASLSKKFSTLELAANLHFTSFGSATTENATSGATGSTDSNTATGVALAARYGFWIVHVAGGVDFTSTSAHSSTSTSGSKLNYPQNNVFTYLAGLDFDIVRDVFVLQMGYRMTPAYTYDVGINTSTENLKMDSSKYYVSFLFQL